MRVTLRVTSSLLVFLMLAQEPFVLAPRLGENSGDYLWKNFGDLVEEADVCSPKGHELAQQMQHHSTITGIIQNIDLE